MTNFEKLLSQIEEMTTAMVFSSGDPNKQPINGEYGNAVNPTNNDFYAKGDARIPKGPTKNKRRKKKFVKEALEDHFADNEELKKAYPNKNIRFEQQYFGEIPREDLVFNINEKVANLKKWIERKSLDYTFINNAKDVFHSILTNRDGRKTINIGFDFLPNKDIKLIWSLGDQPVYQLES